MGVYRGPEPIISDSIILAVDLTSSRGGTISAPKNLVDPADVMTGYSITIVDDVMHFDGISSRIALPAGPIDSLQGWTQGATVEFWLKRDLGATGDATKTGIMQISGHNSTNGCLYGYTKQSIYLDFFRTSRVTVSSTSSDNSESWFDMRDWHHLSVSTGPVTGNWRCMINGIHRYSTARQASISVQNPTYSYHLGRNSGSRDYPGLMGQMTLHNRELTDAEKTHNYNVSKYRYGL